MGNPVDYAINRVMVADIDEYLLKLAFENPNANYLGNWYNIGTNTTVEQGIREQVIHRLVLPDCNVNGGKTEFVDLSSSTMSNRGNGCMEVNVPDIVTGGRKIIGVEEVYIGSMSSATGALTMGMDQGADCTSGTVGDLMQGMVDGMTSNRSMPQTYTNVHMSGNNCFVIFGINVGTFNMTAKCLLEYDAGMSSIHNRHYVEFAHLVELAVKAFIYRKCRRPTNEAIYRCGVPLDDIRDDIAKYSDAWEQYKEFFKGKWTSCMSWSDAELVSQSVQMAVPRRT